VSDYTELFNGTDPRVAAEYAASVLSSVMGTAKSIPATNTPISAIQNKDGESWWKFTGTQGEYYSVALTPFIDDSSLTLYVRDSNDNNIKSETIYGHETDFLDFSTPTTGNYYIRIKGGSDAAGFYNLAVYESWTNTGTLDSDRDLHFDYNTAKYLQDGLHFQQMSPDGEDIYDYYRFKAKANATISITVDSNSGTKTARLYDSNGNSLVSDNIYNGGVETLSKTVFVEGYYYFYVYGSTGSYYLFSDGIIEDSDFDSIPDDEDRYIDTDSDGIQNAVDNDDDNDNIPDSWETANGLNPYISNSGIDTDGDSFNDYTEYLANTDPTDYLSYPSLDCSPVDGRMTIIGKTYSSGFSFCQAEHSIDTSGTVTVKKNAGAVYRAPTVTLDKGFSVENGGFFKAEATNR
jgi:hypothetical protein